MEKLQVPKFCPRYVFVYKITNLWPAHDVIKSQQHESSESFVVIGWKKGRYEMWLLGNQEMWGRKRGNANETKLVNINNKFWCVCVDFKSKPNQIFCMYTGLNYNH